MDGGIAAIEVTAASSHRFAVVLTVLAPQDECPPAAEAGGPQHSHGEHPGHQRSCRHPCRHAVSSRSRAVDPLPFFAESEPAVFLNAASDPAAFLMQIRIQLKQICEKLPFKEISGEEKDNNLLKSTKTMELVPIYCKNFNTRCQLSPISLHFFCLFLKFSSSCIRIGIQDGK